MLNGKPRAYINVCMHDGGPLVLEGDRFEFQWHGAHYDSPTGHALSGPVRPDTRLIMLPTRVEGGMLVYNYHGGQGGSERTEPAAAAVD